MELEQEGMLREKITFFLLFQGTAFVLINDKKSLESLIISNSRLLLLHLCVSSFTKHSCEYIYSREATSQVRVCSHLATAARVKYPAPWGELAKKKLGHAL